MILKRTPNAPFALRCDACHASGKAQTIDEQTKMPKIIDCPICKGTGFEKLYVNGDSEFGTK